MKENTYNGWTNYATWRINLEIFDQWELGDFWGYEDVNPKEVDTYVLGQDMRDYVIQLIDEQSPSDSITNSYANAFINEVNWQEVAQAMVNTYLENENA